jgi:hypothetical protein
MPRQFQLAQIFVALPKDADKTVDDKAKKAVDDIRHKLKTPGADFAAIAIENDSKTSGDLGWLPESQIRPEIRAQVMQLGKGAISEPIRLDDGWHILKLIDTKAAYTRTLAEVRDQLVQQMRSEAQPRGGVPMSASCSRSIRRCSTSSRWATCSASSRLPRQDNRRIVQRLVRAFVAFWSSKCLTPSSPP